MSADDTFFFARQPILDRSGQIVAYELLYRPGNTDKTGHIPQNATAQVVINALNLTGLSNLIQQESKAFINIDEHMLFNDSLLTVPKEHFVLELLETITLDEKVIRRVKEFHRLGFRFALDDIVCTEEIITSITPILPYIDIIKLELPQNIESIEPHIGFFKQNKLTILAEKVETDISHQEMHALGCDLFQGYYFAKPTLISGQKIDTSMSIIFRVVNLLSHNKIDEALNVFEQDVALTIQLLRYMNSAAFSFRSEIKSIRHAIMMLGSSHVKQWLTLMSYAMGSNEGMHSPLLQLAQERSNMMRMLAKRYLRKEFHEDSAFVGLLSVLDALFKKPMDELLKELNIDDHIQHILLHQTGPIGELYQLVLAVEQFDEARVHSLLKRLDIDFKTFVNIITECYRLTQEFNQNLATHEV